MKMWVEYQKERLGLSTYFDDKGFFQYRKDGNFLLIAELYIAPEHRGNRTIKFYKDIALNIAKSLECSHLAGIVRVNTTNPARLVAIYQHIGFEIIKAENNDIVMTLEVK